MICLFVEISLAQLMPPSSGAEKLTSVQGSIPQTNTNGTVDIWVGRFSGSHLCITGYLKNKRHQIYINTNNQTYRIINTILYLFPPICHLGDNANNYLPTPTQAT